MQWDEEPPMRAGRADSDRFAFIRVDLRQKMIFHEPVGCGEHQGWSNRIDGWSMMPNTVVGHAHRP